MAGRQTRVLFVDDDPDFLQLIGQLVEQFVGTGWKTFVARDSSAALGLLQEQPVDLLVIDVHMPVVDGLQFLRLLNRKFPNLLKVVLTGDYTGAYRDACLNSGAELFLEKPRDPGGWQSILATLAELAKFQPEEGFRGVLRRVGLQDVLQMECLARNSSVLEISTPQVQGKIYISEGQIVHAYAGPLPGERGFYQLLALSGGEFNLRPYIEPEVRTICGSWESLLMEAAQQRDEAPAPASPPPVAPSQEQSPADLEAEVLAALQMTEAMGSETTFFTKAVQAEPLPEGARLRPQVEEFLVCSTQGDVLYEWQCPNSNARIDFLEVLSQKARQLAQGLPLGHFERMESSERRGRVVAQIEADRGLFLRASYAPVPPPVPGSRA
jgi:CheY-like chemotaxis protein